MLPDTGPESNRTLCFPVAKQPFSDTSTLGREYSWLFLGKRVPRHTFSKPVLVSKYSLFLCHENFSSFLQIWKSRKEMLHCWRTNDVNRQPKSNCAWTQICIDSWELTLMPLSMSVISFVLCPLRRRTWTLSFRCLTTTYELRGTMRMSTTSPAIQEGPTTLHRR